MKKYRCTNCDYKWEAQDEPFECPKCHSANIESGKGGGSFGDALKKFWWVIVAAIAVAVVAVLLLMPKNSTSVHVDANLEDGVMTVKLAGKHAGEYVITLNNGERRFATSQDSTTAVFTNLVGEYVIDLIYTGTGEAPKVKNFERKYVFNSRMETELEDDADNLSIEDLDQTMGRTTNNPEIRRVIPSPSRISKGESYKITIELSKHGCTAAEAEFSLDNKTWQKSPVFTGLKPGSYDVYARNASNTALTHSTSIMLDEPGAGKCLTTDEVNKLLEGIANYDDKAQVELKKYVTNSTPVKGADADDFITTAQGLISATSGDLKYRVTTVECNGKKIESLTVTRIK